MVDEEKYKKALEALFAYPGWKEEYESAPSELSKRYKGLEYFYREYDEEMDEDEEMYAEYEKECEELEERMDLKNWEYLYRHSGHNPFRTKCREKIEELRGHREKGEEGADGKDEERPD